MSLRTLRISRAAALLPFAITLLVLVGCVFEDKKLEDKRCINDAACVDRFGAGFVCRQVLNDEEGGFCERGGCERDVDCDDGVFCTVDICCNADGAECGADDAIAFGCLIQARDPDDGIACTVDTCDEAGGVLVNDPTACGCTGANDRRCDDNNPCTSDACDVASFSCTNTPLEEGGTCDDGIPCTVNTACDAEGLCVGEGNDGVCDDGEFCNGEEICDPANSQANNEGCRLGTPPSADDGIACTQSRCDEGSDQIEHVPTEACACVAPEDCRPAEVALGCAIFTCQDNACAQVLPADFADEGATCDDGASCTQQDTCQGDGRCLGTPIDALCPQGQRCDPAAPGADAEGCRP